MHARRTELDQTGEQPPAGHEVGGGAEPSRLNGLQTDSASVLLAASRASSQNGSGRSMSGKWKASFAIQGVPPDPLPLFLENAIGRKRSQIKTWIAERYRCSISRQLRFGLQEG